jgi:hypothetical protein
MLARASMHTGAGPQVTPVPEGVPPAATGVVVEQAAPMPEGQVVR